MPGQRIVGCWKFSYQSEHLEQFKEHTFYLQNWQSTCRGQAGILFAFTKSAVQSRKISDHFILDCDKDAPEKMPLRQEKAWLQIEHFSILINDDCKKMPCQQSAIKTQFRKLRVIKNAIKPQAEKRSKKQHKEMKRLNEGIQKLKRMRQDNCMKKRYNRKLF